MFAIWAALFIRSGLILAAAEVLRRVPRSSSARGRHIILLSAFALLLLWPILSFLLPEMYLPIPSRPPGGGIVTVQQTFSLLGPGIGGHRNISWILPIWVAGVILALAPVIGGYFQVHRLFRRASPLHDPRWHDLLRDACRQLGLETQPELLIHPAQIVPFTFGLRKARILLPSDSLCWSEMRRRTVLLHELAHIARRDLLCQLLANCATALWWFQPLCWFARASLRHESERACDALVLESGIRPSDYASQLLEIAQSLTKVVHYSAAAIPVARRGELEGRLYAILDPKPSRSGKAPVAAMAFLAALTVTASAVTILPKSTHSPGGHPMKRTVLSGLLASAGLSAATIAGSVFDAIGSAVPNAQASLINPDTAAKQETATTAEGKFAFESLPAGSYILRVEKPGFASLYREFNVQADTNVKRGLVLNTAPRAAAAQPARPADAQSSDPSPLRVGGEVAQSNLVTKVQPVYPATAKTARLQGKVELEVVISKTGVPIDIRVLASPGDDLTQSALEAVRQWRYSPTLLNGEPIEIITDVIVNYTLAQ